MKKIILTILITAIAIFGLFYLKQNNVFNLGGGSTFSRCVITTTTAVIVGDDISSTILSARSGRSWARIQQPINASSTVSLSMGVIATVGNGLELTESTTTSPVPYIDFGMETDFPYTGIVTGITDGSASSTLLITECL